MQAVLDVEKDLQLIIELFETIDSAIRKAGWEGRITEELRRTVKLRRYQSRKCFVGWEEFVKWRKENGRSVEI